MILKNSVDYPHVFCGMEIQDVITYQEYFMKFKNITNAEDGLLPFEQAAIQDAFKCITNAEKVDFKLLSEEMLIAVEVLEAIFVPHLSK